MWIRYSLNIIYIHIEKGITRRLKTTTTALPITNSATNSKGTVTTESPSNTAVSVEKR